MIQFESIPHYAPKVRFRDGRVFESATQIVTGVERFVGSQIVENGRMIALEFKHPSSRILRLLVPTEIGLELGAHLMVVAAEAKQVAGGQPASRAGLTKNG